jgi:hypothetical protein
MYIEKEILTHYGIPSTYHVLKAMYVYYDRGISHIDIAGYFSKEAYIKGSDAVVVNQIEVAQTSFENEKDIYNAVLSSHVFEGGVLHEDVAVDAESNEEKIEEEIIDKTETIQN